MIAGLPDEWIMAFADGELEPPLSCRVQWALGSDPEAQRKYRAFLSTRPLAGEAFDAILIEPVPERLKRSLACG